MKKKLALLLAVAVLALLLAGCGSSMSDADKCAYDLILDAAYSFKNPSSVRLVSGQAIPEVQQALVRLSATNGFGAETTGYYWLTGSSVTDLENDTALLNLAGMDDKRIAELIQDCQTRGELNVSAINKALAKYFDNN